jgi:hypothetical protein
VGLVDSARVANLLALVGLAACLVTISALAVRRDLDAYAIGAAVVGAFILTNKVLSPNYDLWIVPFFVLLPLARRTWLGYWLADLAIYALVIGHFHGLWPGRPVEVLLPWIVAMRFLIIVVVIRTATAGSHGAAHVDRELTTRERVFAVPFPSVGDG